MDYFLTSKTSYLIIMMGIVSLGSTSIFANKTLVQEPKTVSKMQQTYHPLVTVSVGPNYINQPSAQSLMLYPPFYNHYTVTSKNTRTVDSGLFVGVEYLMNERFNAQLGLSGYFNSSFNVKGHIWQFALPIFDNSRYHYNVHHERFMLEGKILSQLAQLPSLHPYISGQIGMAKNKARSYQEEVFVAQELAILPFANHSKTSCAYGLGLGIDYELNQKIRLGMGYQFVNLGSASLGLTPAELTSETPHLSHIYANQLRFQLTISV
jgi:opacity protein-like surface antigen